MSNTRERNTKFNVECMLAFNKRTLQGLHYMVGYDFTKPFDVLKGLGRFTLNSIIKDCKYYGIDTEDVAATVLVKHGKDALFHSKFYIVDIPNFKKLTPYQHERGIHHWRFNFDTYYGIGDFEAHRKSMTEVYYVIIQKKEYLTDAHKEKQIDYTERMQLVGKTTNWSDPKNNRGGFSSGKFKQENKVYDVDSHFGMVGIYDPLDKSGYWIANWKREQEQKLRAYKANKRKEEATGFDCSQETAELEEKINELKHLLVEMFLNDDYKKVCRVASRYEWMCDRMRGHKKRVSENKYNSIANINNALQEIRDDYNKIMETIEEKEG